MAEELFDIASAINRLKQLIETLTMQHKEALELSIYVRMTSDEGKQYEARRRTIHVGARVEKLHESQLVSEPTLTGVTPQPALQPLDTPSTSL